MTNAARTKVARGEGPEQLILELPLRAAHGADDFLVSGANAAAVELVDTWPDWPEPCALLAGPPGSGKSHLGRVWQNRSQAQLVTASQLSDATVALFQHAGANALMIEDIDRGLSEERVLFHLLNQARESGRHLLLTSRTAPGDLDIALPDLRSRLRALAVMTIAEPDDALLGGVLVKLFADRQLGVDPAVIGYLVRHMDRSFDAARTVVATIDAISLAKRRKVTRPVAAEALAMLGGAPGGQAEDGGT